MNLDLLGLFRTPPGLGPHPLIKSAGLPVAARLRYPLRSHLYRVSLSAGLVALAIVTWQWPFLGFGLLAGGAALYWRGLSLNYGPDALELSWRLHKLARICWSQIFRIDISQRGKLLLAERDQHSLTLDPELEDFDALCAVILKKAPCDIQISPAAAQLLLQRARLNSDELLLLYGPHFLAEASVHQHLWDPKVDPYLSWQTLGLRLSQRFFRARGHYPNFVAFWSRRGRCTIRPGSTVPQEARAWCRATWNHPVLGKLNLEVDYQGYGVRHTTEPA